MPRPETTDAELLRRAVDDADGAAFAELYRRHVDAVLAYVRRRVGQPDLALDITAEVFAVAVEEAHRFRGEGAVGAWLYGIARNKLHESLRRGRVEDEARRRLAHEPVVLTDDDLAEVDARADAGEAQLDAALAELPVPTRTALLARVVDERPYGEIAAELACSEQVVRQRVHRGLRRLRAALETTR
ncbi:MAG: RNA polymerase sigma factor [Patulibacter minatonensis]